MENAPRNDKAMGTERRVATARRLLLAAGLALLGGCAAMDKARVEPVSPVPVAAAQPAPPPPAGPSVTHFTDGREGFVIKEPSTMDAQSRADFDRGVAMIREAKHDQAIELLEKVVAQSPGVTAPHINLAIAYGQLNRPGQAEEQLKKALELIPGHPLASNEYGLLLRKAGRFAESRQIYEKSLAIFPEYHPIHRNLGILCDIYLKDLACAVEHYEVYDRAMPRDKQVKLWLADLNARSGRNITASAGMEERLSMPRP